VNILGIDTSCDETSAAVVADGHLPLSNVIHSQVKLHSPYGGVVPELASREHLRNLMPVVEQALEDAEVSMEDIDGIAVTIGPGLVGALLVGLYYAKGISYARRIPLVAVNHLEGHILSIFLEDDYPSFPFVALTVSGGHTSLYHVMGFGDYRILGQTLDDAAGEAFDKVAKVLGLGYPGGVVIERLALKGSEEQLKFPRAFLSKDSLDFSFSGLKTAVALYVKKWNERKEEQDKVRLEDIAASFQESVIDVLAQKAMKAREITGVKTVMVAGGVACNKKLRSRLIQAGSEQGTRIYYPRPAYCTDNGAMIAVAGYHRLMAGQTGDLSMDVRSKFPIQDLAPIRGDRSPSTPPL
jgi:N6-L-threonylcarbamoyladenine synthase